MSPRIASLIGLATLAFPANAGEPNPAFVTPERVAELVRRVRPEEPPAWTKIPWAGSLTPARAASRKEGCPVFLFALRGDLAANRC